MATKHRSISFGDELLGPTDPAQDERACDRIFAARIQLMIKHPFFGSIISRLKMVNADHWCRTIATDHTTTFYYNSRFIDSLNVQETIYMLGHGLLHMIYEHFSRRRERNIMVFDIATDFAVNGDLNEQKMGTPPENVPIYFDAAYAGMYAEQIYDLLMQQATGKSRQKSNKQNGKNKQDDQNDQNDQDDQSQGAQGKHDRLTPEQMRKLPKGQLLDDHAPPMDELTDAERDALQYEFHEMLIAAAESTAKSAGNLPLGIQRVIRGLVAPRMNWRQMIAGSVQSQVRSNYNWMRPSRRSAGTSYIMPSMISNEETIEVDVYIDMSGSIGVDQARVFISEIVGMCEQFDGYKLRVSSFDTKVYNTVTFTSENNDDIATYVPQGGGGTSFRCIFDHLRETETYPKTLVVFTDGECGDWGPSNQVRDVIWLIHGSTTIEAPHGRTAYYDAPNKVVKRR